MRLVGKYPRLGKPLIDKFKKALNDLIKNCGLDSYGKGVTSGQIIDKTGKHDESILAKEIVGDGVTYLDTGIVPNQNTVLRIWGNYTSLSNQFHGCWNASGNGMFMVGSTVTQWRMFWGGTANQTGGTADTSRHKFELKNGELFVDDVYIVGTEGETIQTPLNSIYLHAFNNNGSPANFTNLHTQIKSHFGGEWK